MDDDNNAETTARGRAAAASLSPDHEASPELIRTALQANPELTDISDAETQRNNQTDSQLTSSSPTPISETEKFQPDTNINNKDASESEIRSLYLSFDTVLPSPTITSESASNGNDTKLSTSPPPCPELRRYIPPTQWSTARKLVTTIISCSVTMLSAAAAGSYAPPQEELTRAWGISVVAYNVGITVFTTGFAIAPMVLAPFSEINGRKPMFIVCGLLYIVSLIGCAATKSYAGMIVARLFCGIGACFFSTMVGGIISDMYLKEDRNTPMAIFSGAALFGTGLGPLYASMVITYTSWRWIFYAQAIVGAVIMVIVMAFFSETRGSIILSRKARLLNKWYEALEEAGYVGLDMPAFDGSGKCNSQRIRWKVKSDEERESLSKMIAISLYRPFHLLSTEPVVFFFSLWVAFSWAVLYLQFASIPLVFKSVYGFSIKETGAVFTSMSVGAVTACVLSIVQEKVALRLGLITLSSPPESRLYFACVESILLPAGLFWFGWTSVSSIHWIVPSLAIWCATMGIFSVYLAVFNYLADIYHRYASSAIAAQSCCRNMLGGIFPLVAGYLFNNVGFSGASSLLGGIGILLTIVPWVLVFWGPKIRARSKFASEIIRDID